MHNCDVVIPLVVFLAISGCISPLISPSGTPPPTGAGPLTGNITVHFIDVGQGDSALILSPSGKVMLIDAGSTTAGSQVVSYIHNQGISAIDIVIATLPDNDHTGGMADVLNSFDVRQFFESGSPDPSGISVTMHDLIRDKNIPLRTVTAGEVIPFDPEVTIRVLNPQSPSSGDIYQDSVVVKLTYGKVSFLFTGDARGDAEQEYVYFAGDVDILKVSDHGSSDSSGADFLAKISPAISVVDVGAGNPSGYPDNATINRLLRTGSRVYRTDMDGTVVITCDGSSCSPNKESSLITTVTKQVTRQPICDCSYNKYNCVDFSSSHRAQACFEYCRSIGKGDIHGLDPDKDGIACEM